MTVPDSAPTVSAPVTAAPAVAPVAWRWRRTALLLALAAQLITIADLNSADRPGVTWAGLLLAIAPVLLAALVAFAPTQTARPAAVVAVVVLVAGMAGDLTHTGLFFLPALVAEAGAAVLLWRRP
jgi:hypothetical protein